MRRRVVPEFLDKRMPFERRLHDASLHTSTASVNQAHTLEPCCMRRIHVLFDN